MQVAGLSISIYSNRTVTVLIMLYTEQLSNEMHASYLTTYVTKHSQTILVYVHAIRVITASVQLKLTY